MTMRSDDDIRERLARSLQALEPPAARVEPVIRRGTSLRRRRLGIGAVVASLAVVTLFVPLVILLPLRVGDDVSEVGPATGTGPLVVSARVPIGRGITDIVGGFGDIWITGASGVTRVDPATAETIAEIHVPGTGDYSRIAVGEGSVWVTAPELRLDGSRGNLVRIDPATDEITATIHVGGPILDVAVGDASVWVTRPDAGMSTVFRINPKTDEVISSIGVDEGSGPLVYGDGSVWVTAQWLDGSVTRVDPVAGDVVDVLDIPNVQAVGDGSLWGVTGDAVLRMDPTSGAVQAKVPIPRAQNVAFDGSTVWVLASPRSSDPDLFEPIARTAAVVRIDPATDRQIGNPVALDDLQPIALTADDGAAWVIDYYDGFLSRIEPVA
jgi:hypothetical protein